MRYDDMMAVESAHILASERGEKVGETVGYKVCNETSISASTCLIFCTPTVILHTLANRGSNLIQGLTHLILDDLHLRSMYLEVAMIQLKDIIIRYQNLKLILNLHPTNATFSDFFEPTVFRTDASEFLFDPKFVKHFSFEACEKMPNVPQIYYLEDVIESGYFHSKMQSALFTDSPFTEKRVGHGSDNNHAHLDDIMRRACHATFQDEMDILLRHLLQLLQRNGSDVNHALPDSSMTPLMIAAANNNEEVVKGLLELDADVRLATNYGWTALDWACKKNASKALALLESKLPCESKAPTSDLSMVENDSILNLDQKRKLKSYLCANDNCVDHKGVALIINNEISVGKVERVLVFVPGVDDVFSILDLLETSDAFEDIQNSFSIIMLHDNFDSSQFIEYLNAVTNKKGKKLFFTIGTYEYSILMENIDVVIDCGKDRSVVFDHLNNRSQVEDCWISKTSSEQRSFLANSPGAKCYRMYTRIRYESFRSDRVSEIVRKPLDNLCLWIRMLAPEGSSIDDYFSQALERPRPFSVKVAVTVLQFLEALNDDTDITELGYMMLNIPIKPRLAKLVLYGLAYKCLDPVLTIASALLVENMFVKCSPKEKTKRTKILNKKNHFAQMSYSDHGAYLKAFLSWLKNREKESGPGTSSSNASVLNYDFSVLNYGQCEMAYLMKDKISNYLKRFEHFKSMYFGQEWNKEFNTFSDNFSMIRAILCAAFFPNILQGQWESNSIVSLNQSRISIDKQSILFDQIAKKMKEKDNCSNWMIYSESKKVNHSASEVSELTFVSSLAVILFSDSPLVHCNLVELAPEKHRSISWDTPCILTVSEHIKFIQFKTNRKDADLLLALRRRLHSIVSRQFRVKTESYSGDVETLQCVSSILKEEDKVLGLKLISGCTQRSRNGQVVAILGYRPYFPSSRGKIRCDFCDQEWNNGSCFLDAHMGGSKGQTSSCLRQKCLMRERELFRKRNDEQRADELKSKNANQSRSAFSKKPMEMQAGLLGYMPLSNCQNEPWIPDQLTRNLIAGQIGKYYPPHQLLTSVAPLSLSNFQMHPSRANEYTNPYFERAQNKGKILPSIVQSAASVDFRGNLVVLQTPTPSKNSTAITVPTQPVCTANMYTSAQSSEIANIACKSSNVNSLPAENHSVLINNEASKLAHQQAVSSCQAIISNNAAGIINTNKTALCRNSNSMIKATEQKPVTNTKPPIAKPTVCNKTMPEEYTIPPGTGRAWGDKRSIEEMPWNSVEESWIWFSKTWRPLRGQQWLGQKDCPWIDASTSDLVKENFICYPVDLNDNSPDLAMFRPAVTEPNVNLSVC
ncbi:3'-5' RNA helicase YTHDC2-like isoform X2 [Convolutriloba macropyga]|uniref:3'-5' RNA helicase YTHDC2-like isoform X2 n=1 Tax=Convolutriloba macropyga TaxID=536237 RepID=UPI003F5235C3